MQPPRSDPEATMTDSRPFATAALSANDQFKLRYPKYLKGAVLAALVLTALFVWLFPGYEPLPYQLRETEVLVLVEIPELIPPLEEPKPREAPTIWRDIEPVDEPNLPLDPLIPPEFWREVPAPPPLLRQGEGFVSSSTRPVLDFFVKADYPEIARRAGLEGTVLVHVLVGANGRVERAEVYVGVHPLLDQAALAAARLCRFESGRQRGVPVKAWVAVPYRFRLH